MGFSIRGGLAAHPLSRGITSLDAKVRSKAELGQELQALPTVVFRSVRFMA